jgi:hypothetical protein
MYAKKILLKFDKKNLEKYGFDLWPKLSHNVTKLDNDDIDISMSHILLFPKIYNLAVCHTIKANQQKSIPCYPTIKFSQQMKHAQRTEKYIWLIFNSCISDDDFFQKAIRIIDTN